LSHLTENPDLMVEALAVMVKRAGGTVTLRPDETLGPFNLMSKMDSSGLHLVLDETLTHADVDIINARRGA